MAFKKPHEVFFRKGILKNFAKNYKKTPAPVSFSKSCRPETQVLSSEF